MNGENNRSKTTVSTLLEIQLALIIPFIVAVIFFADNIIIVLYGVRWEHSATVLKILMIVTLGRGVTLIAVPYIMGSGNFSFASKIKGFETLIFLCGVYFGAINYGLSGASYGAGFGYLFAAIIRLIYLCNKNNINYKKLSKYFLLPIYTILPGMILSFGISRLNFYTIIIETIFIFSVFVTCYIYFSTIFQKNLVKIIRNSMSNFDLNKT
jgi:O-antigen/teichoic acid export membrane protein